MSENKSHAPVTYKSAGVNIDAGNALVNVIRPLARRTARPGSTPDIGGFGGLFDLKACGFRDPVLVASTDGVGTKLMLAVEAQRFDGIGTDLVAMCVNDLVVQGAEPLFFLDYFATGHLQVDRAGTIIESIANGCVEAGCALIGGETAEMPGLYQGKDFDLAGFAVGAAERSEIVTGERVAAGDVILGLASSGVHANGFSLVRRIMELAGADLYQPAPFDGGRTLAEVLLAPTRIYVKSCLAAVRTGLVHGLVHITGGGLIDNVPRILPPGLCARFDGGSWPVPPVFQWLQRASGTPVAAAEMLRTFNCGLGMLVIVDRKSVV